MKYDWSYTLNGNEKSAPTTFPSLLANLLLRKPPLMQISFTVLQLVHHSLHVSISANKASTDWDSKKLAIVEAATYGSEFVAAKTATEQIMDMRYTLRYLGIPIK